MTYAPQPPLQVQRAVGGEHFVVLDAVGVPVAQGERVLCDLVAAGRRVFVPQGALWEDCA